jgi:hypothetical protein
MSTPHTLEKLLHEVPDEERLHSALLLAYINSVYRVLAAFSVPAPLYRLLYDESANHIEMIETQGNSQVPCDGALDIGALDIAVISNLRDIPVLFEGETGVGKTYVTQSFLRTLFPRDSTVSLRLSGNTFLNNIFQPFLEGRIENGMPVTQIKMQAVESIAGMFVDEINRGDPQNVLQFLDNELYNAGQFVRLGIRIPQIHDGQVSFGRRRKKLAILTAQNPPGTADAKFASTLELDAAVDNRLLKINFGNAANSAGTTLWLAEEPADPHQAFLTAFSDLSCRYLGLGPDLLATLPQDWLTLYAWIADPWWTDKPILYSGLELADLMICVLGGNLVQTYGYERQVCHDWCGRLGMGTPKDMDLAETERGKKIQQAIATFRVPVIYRDIVQIKKLADVLATLQTIKDASRTPDPVQAYLKARRLVTVREVAGAAALMTRNKQVSGSASAVPVINEVLVQYTALAATAQSVTKYARSQFDSQDENAGIKKLILAKALRDTLAAGKGTLFLRKSITDMLHRLRNAFSATEDVRNVLLMRILADLLTFCGFVTEHEAEVDAVLGGPASGLPAVMAELIGVYYRLREATALTMPDIYQHRIQRTLGG